MTTKIFRKDRNTGTKQKGECVMTAQIFRKDRNTGTKQKGECAMTAQKFRKGRNTGTEQRGECFMTENAHNFFGTRREYEQQAEEIFIAGKGTKPLEKAIWLAQKIPVLKDLVNDIPVMVNMVKDYTKGRYRKVPFKTISLIAAALLYFINPNDIVPDYLPGVGYLDDAAVISYVLKSVKDDMDEYKGWKCSQW